MVHVPDDLEPEASHARHLSRPREQAHLADVEIAQDLRTDAVVAQIHSRFRWWLIRQGTLPQLLRRFRPVQQHQYAATCFGDSDKRGWNRPGVRAASVIEKVDHREWLVDTNQRLAVWCDLTKCQCEMRCVGQLVAKRDQPEIAMGSAYRPLAYSFHQTLYSAAIVNQVCDCPNLQSVTFRELGEIRQPGHRPVVLHDLAEHRSR